MTPKQAWKQAYGQVREAINQNPYPPSWLANDEGIIGAAYAVRCIMYRQNPMARLIMARSLISAGKYVTRKYDTATGRERTAQGRREYWNAPSLRTYINLP